MNLEEQTLKKAEDVKEWHEIYDQRHDELLEYINQLLSNKTNENRVKLFELFNSEEIQTVHSNTDEFAYMICVINIFIAEIEKKRNNLILDLANSVQDFVDLFIQIKFLLWRIEIEDDSEALENLISFYKNNNCSREMIKSMVEYVSFDKTKVLQIIFSSL